MSGKQMGEQGSNPTDLEGAEPTEIQVGSAPPTVEFIRRRMLLRGATAAAPVILTLRASPALASANNCAIVEMEPRYNKKTKEWSFTSLDGDATRVPWLGPDKDAVTLVSTDDDDCPIGIAGVIDTRKPPEENMQAMRDIKNRVGFVIAASSGGSFTH